MSFTTPVTVNPGDAILSSLWNEQVRDNSLAIRDAQVNAVRVIQKAVVSTTVAANALTGDISGLSISITPSTATSRILLNYSLNVGASITLNTFWVIYRDGSEISDALGDAAGSRRRVTFGKQSLAELTNHMNFTFLDSPATTSQITYSIRAAHSAGSGTPTIYLNRGNADSDSIQIGRSICTVTALEVPT
jgi:hypothetical protein